MDYKEKLKAIINSNKTPFVDIDTFLKYFPELRESEDERVRKTLIHIVKGACTKYGIKYQGQEISEEKLLAWIEKQGEQKLAEWSEEDEKNFSRVDYACLKVYGGDSYSSDWLRKFLGIHKKWKPSDKQMNALEHYMNTLVCNEHKEILFGLYTDLKKLKG